IFARVLHRDGGVSAIADRAPLCVAQVVKPSRRRHADANGMAEWASYDSGHPIPEPTSFRSPRSGGPEPMNAGFEDRDVRSRLFVNHLRSWVFTPSARTFWSG